MANDLSGKPPPEQKSGALQDKNSTANALTNSRYASLPSRAFSPLDPPPTPAAAPPPAQPVFGYAAAPAEDRYDLAGNLLPAVAMPAPQGAPESAMSAPQSFMATTRQPDAPVAAGNAASGTWPPPPTARLSALDQMQFNTSGQQGDVPPEVERLRWNWGAFFFPVAWLKNHGMTTLAGMIVGSLILLRIIRVILGFTNPMLFFLLLGVYALTYFGLQVYFGLHGHQAGWRNRRFHDVEDFLACQRIWMYWGFGIFIVTNVVLPIFFISGFVGAAGYAASHQPSGGSSSSSPSHDPATGFGTPPPPPDTGSGANGSDTNTGASSGGDSGSSGTGAQ